MLETMLKLAPSNFLFIMANGQYCGKYHLISPIIGKSSWHILIQATLIVHHCFMITTHLIYSWPKINQIKFKITDLHLDAPEYTQESMQGPAFTYPRFSNACAIPPSPTITSPALSRSKIPHCMVRTKGKFIMIKHFLPIIILVCHN